MISIYSHALHLHGVETGPDHECLEIAEHLHHLRPRDGLQLVLAGVHVEGDVRYVLKEG